VRTAFLISILSVITACPNAPANAQASLQKCGCHLDSNAPEGTNGSRAANATLCVQQMDNNRHWCEVTIECLRGGIGPDCSPPKTPQDVTRLFFQHINALSSNPSTVAEEMTKNSKETVGKIYESLKYDGSIYDACVDAFVNNKAISLVGKTDFRCAVDKEGWATLRFGAPPYTIEYFFSEQSK
jgi:hypothetical protein